MANASSTTKKPHTVAGLSPKVLKALANPLRYRIQVLLDEREASPKEISEALSEDFYRVCYHVKRLQDAGCIEQIGSDKRHGGEMHIYKAVVRPVLDTIDAKQIPRLLREAGSDSVLSLILADLEDAIDAGTFDSRAARSLLRMGIVVDEQGFDETGEAAMRYLAELSEIESRSTGRLASSGKQGFKAATATLVFPKGERSTGRGA